MLMWCRIEFGGGILLNGNGPLGTLKVGNYRLRWLE
jgi:hypothetical protein